MTNIAIKNKNLLFLKIVFFSVCVLVISTHISTSIAGLFHGILGIIATYSLFKSKKDILEFLKEGHLSWKILFLFTTILSITSFIYFLMPEKTINIADLKKLRYLIFGLLLIPFINMQFLGFLSRKKLALLLNLTFGSLALSAIVGLIGRMINFDIPRWTPHNFEGRLSGFTGSMQFGYESPLFVLMSMVLFLNRKILFEKFKLNLHFVFICTLPILLALITSNTRGGIIALLGALPFIFIQLKPKLFKMFLIISPTLLGLIVLLSFFTSQESSSIRLLSTSKSESNVIRLAVWKKTLESDFPKAPIFGNGLLAAKTVTFELRHKEKILNASTRISESTLFQLIADTGIVGTLLFISFIISWFVESYKRQDIIGQISMPVIVAFSTGGLVHSMFITGTTTAVILLSFYLISQLPLKLNPST